MHPTHHQRHPFHRPRTALCSAGYWFNMAGLIAPLAIGELIKDPDTKWRAIRVAALLNGAVSGMFWSTQVKRRREWEQVWRDSPDISR
jgi:hypothetical protein